MFCSTIIPTIGRPSLARAVESVLQQTLDGADFEVIVVNDSGQPLREAPWQRFEHVRVVNTNRRERSVARNTGAAMARGQYLHFLDDDDWLAPDAYSSFWQDIPAEGVGWFYGVSQLVDRQGAPTIRLHHKVHGNCFLSVMAGEWIPLQASLINSDAFFAVGGFNPQLSGPEDIDILRRVALKYDVARTDKLVTFIEMGEEGSTTDYRHHPQFSRWAREHILDEPEAFDRMRPSASDAYWKGRLARVYLTSVVWNVRNLQFFTAASRAVNGGRSFALSGRDLFSISFWRSLAGAYASPTFARGWANAPAIERDLDTPTAGVSR